MSLPPEVASALAERFAWERLLGEGAHGWVGLAVERALGRRVALKVGKHRGDAARLARFEREAQIAASLQHANLVRVHSMGTAAGHPFLVMEYIEGARTLGDLMRVTPPAHLLSFLEGAAAGLAYAHAQGVVHRDLKPENVLVTPAGVAQVTDFGCATMRGVDRLTATGALLGTPLYMSPEQLNGARDAVQAPADVWALGVMLHEVSCGALPFQGDSLFELVAQVQAGTGPITLLPEVPATLRPVIERCLDPVPARRFADGAAVLSALTSPPERSAARRPWLVGAVVAVPMLLLGAWAARVSAPEPEPQPPPKAGGESPPAKSDPPAPAAPPPPPDVAAWNAARLLTGEAFLVAGEAFLANHPESALRTEVHTALVKERLARPRWIHRLQGNAYPRPAATREQLLLTQREPGGHKLYSGAWGSAPLYARLHPGLYAATAAPSSPGCWGIRKHNDTLRVTHHEGIPEAIDEPGLALPPRDYTVFVRQDGLRLATVSTKEWVVLARDATSNRVTVLGRGPCQPPLGERRWVHFAGGEGLSIVTKGRNDEAPYRLIRLATPDSAPESRELDLSVSALLTLSPERLVLATYDGRLLLVDANLNVQATLHNPKAGATLAGEPRAIPGAFITLARGAGDVIYAAGRSDKSRGNLPQLHAWQLEGEGPAWQASTRRYRSLCVSANQRYLACSTQGRLEIWDRYVPGEWSP